MSDRRARRDLVHRVVQGWRRLMCRQGGPRRLTTPPKVGLVWWGDLYDDMLTPLDVSIEALQSDFCGSWVFNYIDALRSVGVPCVLYCFTRHIGRPLRFTHRPSGAEVCVLPTPAVHRWMQSCLDDADDSAGSKTDLIGRVVSEALGGAALYLSTPLFRLGLAWRQDGCTAVICQGYDHERFDMSVLLGRLLRIPVFGVFQAGHDQDLGRFHCGVRTLALRASAGLIIGARDEVLRMQLRYPVSRGKIAHIFNPVDPDTWQPMPRMAAREAIGLPPDAEVAVWHGRVVIEVKGLDLLIQAWVRTCQARPGRDLRLVIVGTGVDTERLDDLIERTRPPGLLRVDKFVHDRREIYSYLSAADVYVFPSRGEGFPIAPMEAMVCGLPVVTTDVHGICEIFPDSEASGGVIVPAKEAAALAAALGRVLDDEPLRRQLGRRARQRVEAAFSPERVGRQLQAFLRLRVPAQEPAAADDTGANLNLERPVLKLLGISRFELSGPSRKSMPLSA